MFSTHQINPIPNARILKNRNDEIKQATKRVCWLARNAHASPLSLQGLGRFPTKNMCLVKVWLNP
jgi:hypothetical protein